MKIGIFTDCYYPQINGVVTSIVSLETCLKKLGHEVYIITVAVPDFQDKDTRYVIRIPSVPFLKWSEFRIGLFFKHTKLYKTVKNIGLDIVHTQTEFTMGWFGKFIAKDLKIPAVHTYHTVYEEYTHYISNIGQAPLKKICRKLSKKYISFYSAVIVPTKKTKDLLLSYRVTNAIYIVPTGIDLQKFQAAIDQKEFQNIKTAFRLSETSFKLLFLGRTSKEKNIDMLIRVLPALFEKYENVDLIIVGDGPHKDALETLVHTLHIADRVVFTNRVSNDQVPLYYKLADLFISPSASETQGLTIVEAMAAGIPILAYNDGNIEGIIFDKHTGLLFKTKEELLGQLIFALEHREALRTYSSECLKLVEQFSSQAFAKKIERIYMELVAASSSKRAL